MKDKHSRYNADKAITSSSEDVFNRSGFAKRLANALADTELSGGYVVGLYSQWGYGKTSTINMVEEYLNKRKESKDDIVLVKFNPWIFSDYNSMISGLFNDLAVALGEAIPNKKERLGETLKKYSRAFQPLSFTASVVGIDAGGTLAGVGDLLSNINLDEMKSRLEAILDEAEKRVVVIVDDVDRLDKDEIFQLFKVIKVVVDFKNISYLMAFDDKVVSKALGERYGNDEKSGKDFIDKIVQVPLHLPLIEQDVLNKFILNGVDNIIKINNIELNKEDIDRFRMVFDKHIAPFIDSPRLANRYINSLRFVVPLVGEEINVSDLLLIEGIRLLDPTTYNSLRKERLLFTKGSFDFWGQDSPAEVKASVTAAYSKTPNNITEVIKELFPVVNNALKEHGGDYVDHKALRESKRVASIDYFDRYFTYGIPLNDVSDLKILELVQNETDDILVEMRQLISEKGASTVIKKLRQFESQLSNPENLCEALVMLSANFSEDKGFSFDDTDKEALAKFLVVVCKNQPEAQRLSIIKKLLSYTEDIELIAHFSKWINLESENEGKQPDNMLLNKEKLAELRPIIATKIKQLVLSMNKLMLRNDASNATYLYQEWATTLGRSDLDDYFKKYVTNTKRAEDLIISYTSLWVGTKGSFYANLGSESYNYMKNAFDPAKIAAMLIKKYKFSKNVEWIGFDSHTYDSVSGPKSSEFRRLIAQQYVYHHQQENIAKDSNADSAV